MNAHQYVVIMAGGIGSRFWPFSRQSFPKQFHDILGTGRTMIQETADRFEGVVPPENIYVVTNRDYEALVAEQLPYLSPGQILTEPTGRNTAPCIAYACYKILARDPEANVVVSPADHVIANVSEFKARIQEALDVTAQHDVLCTLGIHPSRPDTGYGYIQYHEAGAPAGPGSIDTSGNLRKVKTFTEKPHMELARQFVESGEFVWNAGIFVWNARTFVEAIGEHLPDMAEIFAEAAPKFHSDQERDAIDAAYSQCKNISVDYGIMEKDSHVYVLLSDFGWSDLGTWKSLYELAPRRDERGNVIEGNVMLYDTEGTIVKTGRDKLVVACGLRDFILAEYDGVIMICPKDEEQRVKEFVADAKALKDRKFI